MGDLEAGGEASTCTFAGVGKARDEIEYALRFLLPRMERSFAAARRLAAAADRTALARRKDITVPLLSSVLQEIGGETAVAED